jgi:hypothetical protein
MSATSVQSSPLNSIAAMDHTQMRSVMLHQLLAARIHRLTITLKISSFIPQTNFLIRMFVALPLMDSG